MDLPSNAKIIAISPDIPQNGPESARAEPQTENAIIPMRRTKWPEKGHFEAIPGDNAEKWKSGATRSVTRAGGG